MEQQKSSLEEEWNEWDIETQRIVKLEMPFLSDPANMPFRKYPLQLGFELESIIRSVLVKNTNPTVEYSDGLSEYLIEKNKRFYGHDHGIRPFDIDYFVIAYDVPRQNTISHVKFGSGKYLYLYSYDQYFNATRDNVDAYQFELLFAFTLRQFDLMKIDMFLDYHLEKNFRSEIKSFLIYLTQLTRKFSSTLFTKHLTKSIEDWISRNRTLADEVKKKKVKTYLTVDKLSYLFRILVDMDLISNENKALVIKMITDNFQSKMRENLSKKSVEDKFYNPSDDALGFWKDQFKKLASQAEKDEKNNLM